MQINRAASKETCFKKYDEIVSSPPNAGYSQEALYSRAVVLKSATEAVIDRSRHPDMHLLFESTMTELQHRHLNNFLNDSTRQSLVKAGGGKTVDTLATAACGAKTIKPPRVA